MGSGKYGALSGAMARMQMLDNINNNLSNVNTTAYKKGVVVFDARLTEAQAAQGKSAGNLTHLSAEIIDFSQGQLNKTGNPMHLAINGKGFFQILQKDGERVYARRGNFQSNQFGEMVTSAGGKLLGEGGLPVKLPPGEFTIMENGNILGENQQVGSIPLYVFTDTNVLKRGNDGVFIASSTAQVILDSRSEVMQGFLEGSNVNVMQATAQLISNTRSFEAAQKVLTSYGKMGKFMAELGGVQ